MATENKLIMKRMTLEQNNLTLFINVDLIQDLRVTKGRRLLKKVVLYPVRLKSAVYEDI